MSKRDEDGGLRLFAPVSALLLATVFQSSLPPQIAAFITRHFGALFLAAIALPFLFAAIEAAWQSRLAKRAKRKTRSAIARVLRPMQPVIFIASLYIVLSLTLDDHIHQAIGVSLQNLVVWSLCALFLLMLLKRWVSYLLEKREFRTLVQKHEDVLRHRWETSRIPDEFGAVDKTGWERNFNRFVKSTKFLPRNRSKDYYRKHLERRFERQSRFTPASVPHNPIQFENWCGNVLRKHGWNVVATPVTGDQGVDVLATREGKSIAIQCKRYSKPVGNEAVQQAEAGRQFYDAESAAVVATPSFTRSARTLAHKTGVTLLSPSELSDFASDRRANRPT